MEKIKIAIIGSRDFKDKARLFRILDKNFDKIEMIISGGARGADELGRVYAQERGFPCLIYYPRWYSINAEYDRGAGFKRNHLIIKEADVVVAFWDGESKGTRHSIELAESVGKKVKIFRFQKETENIIKPSDKPSDKPSGKSFAEEWAEYKAEEIALEEAKYVRSTATRRKSL